MVPDKSKVNPILESRTQPLINDTFDASGLVVFCLISIDYLCNSFSKTVGEIRQVTGIEIHV